MTDFANATPNAVDIVKRETCFKGFYSSTASSCATSCLPVA